VRATYACADLPTAESIVTGDLEMIAGAVGVAEAGNALGPCDAVIHNAGVFDREYHKTPDGFPRTFAVNVLAPYVMTALIRRPARFVYSLPVARATASAPGPRRRRTALTLTSQSQCSLV